MPNFKEEYLMSEKMKYGVVETSKIRATYMGGGHIFSVVDSDAALENGTIVALGDPINTYGNEEYKALTPTKSDAVVLIADVPLIYDQSTTVAQAEYNFVNEIGKSTRAYTLQPRDMYAVSEYLITKATGTTVAAGNLIVAKDRKYQEVAKTTDVSAYGFVAKVRYTYIKSGVTMVMLEIVKNTKVEATSPSTGA